MLQYGFGRLFAFCFLFYIAFFVDVSVMISVSTVALCLVSHSKRAFHWSVIDMHLVVKQIRINISDFVITL